MKSKVPMSAPEGYAAFSLVLHYLTVLELRKLFNFCLEFKKGLTQEKLLIQNFRGCIYNLNDFRNAHQ